MDTHTLELLEFDKIRGLVAVVRGLLAGQGRGAAAGAEPRPGRDPPPPGADDRDGRGALGGAVAAVGRPARHPGRTSAAPRSARCSTAEELAEAAEVLRAIGNLDRWLGRIGDEFPRLGALRQGVGEFSGVASAIESCLDSRGQRPRHRQPQALGRAPGDRRRSRSGSRRPSGGCSARNELRRILRYPNFTMVGHHYVLPIAKEHRGEIQGSVHRTSASNETVFIEPQAIAEQSAQLSFLRAKEAKEIRRILRWLSAQVGQVAESLLGSLETLAELDLIYARGRYSLDYRMTPPDLNDRGPGRPAGGPASAARIPLPRRGRRAGQAAADGDGSDPRRPSPASEADAARPPPRPSPPPPRPPRSRRSCRSTSTWASSSSSWSSPGPNTGGKTVALKTVGPAGGDGAVGPAHPGAARGRSCRSSTTSWPTSATSRAWSSRSPPSPRTSGASSQILARATERSLVLLDELGAGTDPAEGAALGRAILDELDSIGCRAMVTTHIGDLKTYAFTNHRAENAAVEFDVETLRPLYRRPDRRHRPVERPADRPPPEPARAPGRPGRAATSSRPGASTAPSWEVVQKLRKEAEEARQTALAAQAEAERTRDALNQRLADLQRQAENDARLDEARARLQPGDRVVVPRFGYDRPGRVVKLDPRKNIAVVAIGQMKWDVPIAELIPQMIRPPEAPAPPSGKPKPTPARGVPRLEDFHDLRRLSGRGS